MKAWLTFLGLGLVLGLGAVPALAQNSVANRLSAMIVREETAGVKRSTGTEAYNCFTNDDLALFRQFDRAHKIAEHLKADPQFKAVVADLAALSASSRAEILAKARKIAQPTYAMTGYIDSSGKSQTEAGRIAELEIAAAICSAIEQGIAAGGKS